MQLLRVNVGWKTFKGNVCAHEILNIQHIQSVAETRPYKHVSGSISSESYS
jgi:hypothetical protein